MNIFDLEVDKGYEYKGKFYSSRGWDHFINENGFAEPTNIFTRTTPIQSNGIDDAKKCAVYDCLIGAQLFSDVTSYDSILNVYLSVLANDFRKEIRLPEKLVSPDAMYTLLCVNHPDDYEEKGDSFSIIRNVLQMAKVQLGLSAFYQKWKDETSAGKPGDGPAVSFERFCDLCEEWEELAGDETVLTCMTNINKPKHPVLGVDFIDARTRIVRLLDQVYFELNVQGKAYKPEDIDKSMWEMFEKQGYTPDARNFDGNDLPPSIDDLLDNPSTARDPKNDSAWEKFIEKNKKDGWLDFNEGLDLTKDEDDDPSDEDFS